MVKFDFAVGSSITVLENFITTKLKIKFEQHKQCMCEFSISCLQVIKKLLPVVVRKIS